MSRSSYFSLLPLETSEALTAAFLLSVRCVSAGLGSDLEQGANSSLPGLNPGQFREFGRPLYRIFTKRDEGVVNHIFSAIQDSRGLMLFGSVNCILEYDGQRWTSIPVPNGGWIQEMASDRTGTIWIGGTGEVGALVLSGGTYQYKSYTHLVPESGRHFWIVFGVAVQGDDVCFLTDKTLLRWTGQHFSVIPLPYELGSFWEIRARQSGLHFEFSIDPSIPRCVETDPLRLRQIIYNQALASEGDVVALRVKLQELSQKNPDYTGFAGQLAELASAYRIEELEMLLEQAISETATAAPGPGALQSVNEAGTVAP